MIIRRSRLEAVLSRVDDAVHDLERLDEDQPGDADVVSALDALREAQNVVWIACHAPEQAAE